MTKKVALFITTYITTAVLFFACNKAHKTDGQKSTLDTTTSVTKSVLKNNDEDGPPFSDTCLCSFDDIGKIRTNPKRFDLILSGKGWNPTFYSCSWTWGEIIYNESLEDTTITDFRIHLLDVDKLDKNLDSSFLTSSTFNDHLIATFSRTNNDEYRTCKFDPNKTGKYPKPKQWTEE